MRPRQRRRRLSLWRWWRRRPPWQPTWMTRRQRGWPKRRRQLRRRWGLRQPRDGEQSAASLNGVGRHPPAVSGDHKRRRRRWRLDSTVILVTRLRGSMQGKLMRSISAWPQAACVTATATGRRRCHPTGTPSRFQRPRRFRRRHTQGRLRRLAVAGRDPPIVAHARRRPSQVRLAQG